MTGAELIDRLSVVIYDASFRDHRHDELLRDLNRPLSVVILMLDFMTEVEMGGVVSFLGNSSGKFALETAEALSKLGTTEQAKTLQRIISIARDAGMTHQAIQQDRSAQRVFEVTTFRRTHGDKWDAAVDQIRKLEDGIDVDVIVSALERFAELHMSQLKPIAGSSSIAD